MNKVSVLMSTYNGEKYLRKQINSILNQEGVIVQLLVRDDGSTDSTIEILQEYEQLGKLKWYLGENIKPARSFLDLISNSEDCEYYAFSDQDDYWLPNKLYEAIKVLQKQSSNIPSLYYSHVILVDSKLNKIKQKVRKYDFVKFNYAVVSSNAAGCTFCFNKKLRDMVNQYKPNYQIMHDGWLHKLCLALDGYVYCDKNSYIFYRQHNDNVIGGTSTILSRWKRRIKSIIKDPCSRSKGIEQILIGYKKYLSKENYMICKEVVDYKRDFCKRLNLLFDKKICSPDLKIDFMYRLAVFFGVF